ncbi:MAG: hypothetical protein ACLQMF_12545 [Rectinemataceae bacterium]
MNGCRHGTHAFRTERRSPSRPVGRRAPCCALLLLVASMLARPGAFAEGKHCEYENVERQIALMLAGGTDLRLIAVIDDETAMAEESELVSRIRSLLSAAFSSNKDFVLISVGRLKELAGARGKVASDAEILTLCAAKGATLALIVSVERYASGDGEMDESAARLVDVASARELARDVVWTVVSSEGNRSVFVDGVRVE